MKTQKNSFIFAAVLGVMLGANPLESQATGSRVDSSAKAQLLSAGNQEAFSAYVSENLTRFSKKEDWANVKKIVTLYGQLPSQLKKATSADREVFERAVGTLGKKLNRLSDEQGEKWANDLGKTADQIQFIWNFDLESLTPGYIDTPLPITPANAKSIM